MAMRSFRLKQLVQPTVFSDEEWKRLEAPTLYLVGENERIYRGTPQEAVERINTAAPQVKAEILPECGHDLTVLRPEMVNTRVVQFLEGE
jgi:pimeloyl-ACP methyl ester carboxylesterase